MAREPERKRSALSLASLTGIQACCHACCYLLLGIAATLINRSVDDGAQATKPLDVGKQISTDLLLCSLRTLCCFG
jgi:hypothetical protein